MEDINYYWTGPTPAYTKNDNYKLYLTIQGAIFEKKEKGSYFSTLLCEGIQRTSSINGRQYECYVLRESPKKFFKHNIIKYYYINKLIYEKILENEAFIYCGYQYDETTGNIYSVFIHPTFNAFQDLRNISDDKILKTNIAKNDKLFRKHGLSIILAATRMAFKKGKIVCPNSIFPEKKIIVDPECVIWGDNVDIFSQHCYPYEQHIDSVIKRGASKIINFLINSYPEVIVNYYKNKSSKPDHYFDAKKNLDKIYSE